MNLGAIYWSKTNKKDVCKTDSSFLWLDLQLILPWQSTGPHREYYGLKNSQHGLLVYLEHCLLFVSSTSTLTLLPLCQMRHMLVYEDIFSWCTQFEWSLGGSQPRISYTSSATPVAFGWSNRNISLSLHFDCMREQWNSWHIPQDWPLFDDDCNTVQAVIKPLMLGWENLILSTLLKWKLQVIFKGSSTTVITKWPIIYSLQYGKKRKMFEENLVRIKVRINKLK